MNVLGVLAHLLDELRGEPHEAPLAGIAFDGYEGIKAGDAVLTFNFWLFRIVPGDPVSMIVSPRMRPETRDRIREQYGLDLPVWFNFEAVRETGEIRAVFDLDPTQIKELLSS